MGQHVAHPARHPADEKPHPRGYQNRRNLPFGIGEVHRVVGNIDIGVLGLREQRQAREEVAGQKAAGGQVVPARPQVVEIDAGSPLLASEKEKCGVCNDNL